jgi:hypothetical protein
MIGIFRYVLYAALVFPLNIYGKDYSERVESFSMNGQNISVLTRSSSFEDGTINQIRFALPEGTQKTFSSVSGNLSSNKGYASFSQPVFGQEGEDVNTFLNSMHYSVGGGYGSLSFEFQIDQTSLANTVAAQKRISQFQRQATANAQAWLKINERQSQYQDTTVTNLNTHVASFKLASESSMVDSTLAVFSSAAETSSLKEQIELVELLDSMNREKKNLESLNYSDEKQEILSAKIGDLYSTDPERSGELVSDLNSPLNQNLNEVITNGLASRGVHNGVLPGKTLPPGNLKFEDPQFEDSRLRIQNKMQATGKIYPRYLKAEGRYGPRASQLWLHAAQKAEAGGDMELARTNMLNAEQVAASGPSHSSWSKQNYAKALRAYSGIYHPTQGLKSTNQQFLKIAEPVAGFLESKLSVGSQEDQAMARAGWQMTQHADSLSAQGDDETAEAYLGVSIVAIDVLTGFVAPVSFVKDSYEALTGKHWITGEKLSDFDRSLALGGAMTLGFGSAALKGVKALKTILKQGKISEKAISGAHKIHKAFKSVKAYGADTVEAMRYKLRNIKTIEGVQKGILNTKEKITTRLSKSGFDYRIDELKTSGELNRKSLAQKGGYPYVKPNTWAYKITSDTAPETLVRVSADVNVEGAWFFHKDLLNHYAKDASNAEEFALKLKSELNIGYSPTKVSIIKPSNKKYKMTVSEIKQVPDLGLHHGQLQFQMEKRITQRDLKETLNIEDVFRAGGL